MITIVKRERAGSASGGPFQPGGSLMIPPPAGRVNWIMQILRRN